MSSSLLRLFSGGFPTTFQLATNQTPGSTIESNWVRLDLASPVTPTVTGGQVQIKVNGVAGDYTDTPREISGVVWVRVKGMASMNYLGDGSDLGVINVVLTVGLISKTFEISTKADAFPYTFQDGSAYLFQNGSVYNFN